MRRKRIFLILVVLCCCVLQSPAQTLGLSIPDTTVAPNDTILIPIRTKDFVEIVSMQFSLRWDTTVLRYQTFRNGDLENVAVGDFQASKGELRLSWFDVEGAGRTLMDSSVVTKLKFLARGAEGSKTPINFVDTPLPIQIFRSGTSAGQFVELKLVPQNGIVTIAKPTAITVSESISQISCFGAKDGKASITVTSTQAYNIRWTGPNFTSDKASISGLGPGQYQLLISNSGGAKLYESTIVITEPEQMVITSIAATDADCKTGLGRASVVFQGGVAPFRYDIGIGPGGVEVLENLSPGNYTLNLIDANGCTATDTFSIKSNEITPVNLGGPYQICQGESTTIAVSGNYSTYTWSTGATSPSIVATQAGVYGVTVTNAEGCNTSAEAEVEDGRVSLKLENDFLDICPGDTIELIVSGAEFYTWIDTSGTLNALDVSNPNANPDTTMMYKVIGESSCGIDSLELEVFVKDLGVMAGPDTCVTPETEAQLLAFGGVSYLWEEARFPVSNPTIPNPTSMPEDSVTYFVTIVGEQGCIIRDSMTVLVAIDPESSIIPVNLITPNGDGKNDVLHFPNIVKFGQNSLKVFNRWGNVVYQKVNYMHDEDRFDGFFNGELLPTGTYYYVLEFRTGSVKQKLTILR